MAARNLFNLVSLLVIAAMATMVQSRLTFSHNFCGNVTDAIQPVKLDITPNNVNPGANITFINSINVTRPVSNGTVMIVAQSNGATIWQQTTDLCSFATSWLGVACPIKPAVYNFNKPYQVIPDPLGNVFVVNFYAFDNDPKTVTSLVENAQQFVATQAIEALQNFTAALGDTATLNAKLLSYEAQLQADIVWAQKLESDLKPMWCSQLVAAIRPLF